MRNLKWLLITLSLLAITLNNSTLVNAEDGGGDSGGEDSGDFDSGADHDTNDFQDNDGHHHHSDHHHHHHFNVGIGGYYDPWLWNGYYSSGFWGGSYYNPGFFGPGLYGYRTFGYTDPFFTPYYTYPRTVVAPSPPRPPAYIQQQTPQRTESITSYWHYCKDPEGYYPHIKDCPGGWLRVAPQPIAP